MSIIIQPMRTDEAKDVQQVARKLRQGAIFMETAVRGMALLRKRSGVETDFRRELDEVAIALNHAGFATGLIEMAEEPDELRRGRDDVRNGLILSLGASRCAEDVRASFAAVVHCLVDAATNEVAIAQVWGFDNPDTRDAFLALKRIDELLAGVKRP